MSLRQSSLFELAFDSSQLQRLKAKIGRDFLTAARTAVRDAGRQVEKDLEGAYESAGLGKLARAWSSKVYPRTGLSDSPTADVRPKGKARTVGAIRAAAYGADIRAKGSDYLAIPLKAAGPRFAGRGKVPIGPQEWQRRTGLRLDVARINGKLYLVTRGVRAKSGRIARKATLRRLEQGRKVERLLIFLLLPEVQVRKRVNIEPIFRRGSSYLNVAFAREVNALLARDGQAPAPGQ
jgi:hypothetical protein